LRSLFPLILATIAVANANAAPQHRTTWKTLTVPEKRAVLQRVIHRGRTAERWWLSHRSTFDVLPSPAGELCPSLGIRTPAGVCVRATAARHARVVLKNLEAMLTDTGDWVTAVEVVQRVYPGSEGWLLSCSSSEGGHGQWVWRGGAPYSGESPDTDAPGGWMQYFQSTFWTDFDSASADLAERGFYLPPDARSWLSPLGQAVAAGWAYEHDRPPGKWTGWQC
jgi:hypothetical protein